MNATDDTRRDEVRAAVIEELQRRAAATIEHPGGTLLAHLVRTDERLQAWGAPDFVALAGLAHAAYGTDGFPVALFDLTERPALRALIGDEVETLVYLYCSCDRDLLYPQLGDERVTFRDRFTDETQSMPIDELRPFLELSFANELDICDVSDDWRAAVGPDIVRAFGPAARVVSPRAAAALDRLRHALAA